jgi:hypothetical protein
MLSDRKKQIVELILELVEISIDDFINEYRKEPNKPESPVYSLSEVCGMLKISRWSLERLLKRKPGLLEEMRYSEKINSKRFFSRKSVHDFVKNKIGVSQSTDIVDN